MAWNFKGKTYRNLEEQVLENQNKSIKNEEDIKELKKGSLWRVGSGNYSIQQHSPWPASAEGDISFSVNYKTLAKGDYSASFGYESSALGNYSFASGAHTQAKGKSSHAEGMLTMASGEGSHSEGLSTIASGTYAHSEGRDTEAFSDESSTRGMETSAGCKGYYVWKLDATNKTITLARNIFEAQDTATTPNAFSIGYSVGDKITFDCDYEYVDCSTITLISNNVITVDQVPVAYTNGSVPYSQWSTKSTLFVNNVIRCLSKPRTGLADVGWTAYAEGVSSNSYGYAAHAEGTNNIAKGANAHVEGAENIAGYCAHAEGRGVEATGLYAHAEGRRAHATADVAHAEGTNTTASGEGAHAEGYYTVAEGNASHAEGTGSKAYEVAAHAEGRDSYANSEASHAEGEFTSATGIGSHTEGYRTKANGKGAHHEGIRTDGSETITKNNIVYTYGANADASHAEGINTVAGKDSEDTAAHAEGADTIAAGWAAHAEGLSSYVVGDGAHAEGWGTIAKVKAQHVEGKYNADEATALHITGCGNSNTERANCFTAGLDSGEKYIRIGNTQLTETALTNLLDIVNPVVFQGPLTVGQNINLPYTGAEMANHLNLTIHVNTIVTYLLRMIEYYHRDDNVIFIRFDASTYAGDGGYALYISGQPNSNIYKIEAIGEV